jgi:hypothetical protein
MKVLLQIVIESKQTSLFEDEEFLFSTRCGADEADRRGGRLLFPRGRPIYVPGKMVRKMSYCSLKNSYIPRISIWVDYI